MYSATSITMASLQSQQYMLWKMVEQNKQENGVMRKMIETDGRMAALDRTLEVQVGSFLCTVRYVCSYPHGSPLNFDVAHLATNPGFLFRILSCNFGFFSKAATDLPCCCSPCSVHSNNSFVDISSLRCHFILDGVVSLLIPC